MKILIISLTPVVLVALYIYLKDKYEREPIGLLLRALLAGAVITLPIIFIEQFFMIFSGQLSHYMGAGYDAFVVAAFTEELLKYLAFIVIIWRNKNFNEKFDGIVYASFISLGFAGVENILYVINYGSNVALIRAFTAVPAHALFGISMGYHLGLAKFLPNSRKKHLLMALLLPILLHGIYDFILFIEIPAYFLIFVPYLVYLWIVGFKKMKKLSEASVFKPKQ